MKEYARAYQPINAYGVIGNCHTALLVAPDGSVDWGCLPDFDSPALFCRLLDAERGGYFQIAPTDKTISSSQRYLRDSNVLQTTFTDAMGSVVLTDFMPVAVLNAWLFGPMDDSAWTQHNDACHCLVRMVQCTQGEMALTVTCKVTPHYAASPGKIFLAPDHMGAVITDGQQHVALAIIGSHLLPSFTLCILDEKQETSPALSVQVTLHEGERLVFAVGAGADFQEARRLVMQELPGRNFYAELAHTLRCWRHWIAGCTYQGEYSEWVRRSALTLKMLFYAPTGAFVAAPTTSLPEQVAGTRNWDYRYTWLRNAVLALNALDALGLTQETHAFMGWLLQRCYEDGEDLQAMYGIRGERDLLECELVHLSGYRDSYPVRIGSKAAIQKQLHIFGEIVEIIYIYWYRHSHKSNGRSIDDDMLQGPLWSLLYTLVEYVCVHWRERDSGIWEMSGGTGHFVYSKVMCWVALDRGIRLAQLYHPELDITHWRLEYSRIRQDILSRGYDIELQAFTQTYDNDELDASNLLLPLLGFIDPNDPRMLSTIERIMQGLSDEQGLIYRYRCEDGLAGGEGVFLPCTFWLIDNLIMQGRVTEARSLFERVLTCAGPLGLFSEEAEAGTGAALGNYPQALTHIALINTAVNLQRAELHLARSRSA
jgi:GH15 family glucan-1,4-alpha-glucosidase